METWSNSACLGYVIKAMENLGYSPEDIQAVVSEINYAFDSTEIDEAAIYFEKSPY